MEIQFVFFIFGLCNSVVHCWPCPQDVTVVYARPGSRAVLAFQTTIQSASVVSAYDVVAFNGSNLCSATFYNGNFQNLQTYLNSTFIGDALTGNFTLQTNNLQIMDAGVYMLQHVVDQVTTTVNCSTLYILGIQTQPVIQSSNDDPSVGDNVTLTCESTSTTSPTNHSLSRSYKWNVDNSSVTSSGRYSLSGNTLAVSNVVKSNTNLKFTCTATEVITNGYTSDSSGEYSINVLYGPFDDSTTNLNPPASTTIRNEGDTLSDITCSADCYPACSYKWTKSGTNNIVSSTGVLSLETLTRSEDGTYTCTVTSSWSSVTVTRQVAVTVRYGPDAGTTTLSPAKTTYTQNEGTSLNAITCVGDCYPACNYKWTKPGTTVSNTGVLSLGTLSKNEAAIYTCTVTNNNTLKSGSVTKRVTVNVISITMYTQNEGTSLNAITCVGDCYPACSYKWTKPGTTVSNTGMLSLGTLSRNEAAIYTCTVTNPGKSGSVAKHVTVNVRYGPDTCDISVASPYTVREGNSIPTITCQSDCYPTCSEGWNNISTNTPVGSDGDLSLGTVTRYKAGNYACTCSNIVQGSYEKSLLNTVHVIVQYPPDVSVLLSTTDMSEGKELMLTCDVKGVPSVYNYKTLSQTWGHSDIHNTHSAASGTPMYSSLRIPSLQLQDSGTYTCHVNNGIKNTQGVLEDSVDSVFIKVQVSPKIITQVLRFTGVTGGTANIRVEFYSDPDILTVIFKRDDGLAITNGNKYNVSHYGTEVSDNFHGTDVTLNGSQANMIISDLKPEDFGVYTLTLSNPLSTTDTKVILGAETRLPEEPTHFRYLFKDNTLTFAWIGGFNGGYTQTFVIQTSSVGTGEWINRTTITEIVHGVTSYQSSITALPPGIYFARIFAWTIKGTSEYVRLNGTSYFIKIESDPEMSTFPVAVVAGGFSTVIVVLIAVAGAVVFYKRTYGQKDKKPSRSSSSTNSRSMNIHNTTVQETAYYNVAKNIHTTTVEETSYDTVANSTYEALDARIEALSTYASLTSVVEQPAARKMTYENLQLHNVSS